ncbi:MAG: hypothetical protein SynsKO_26230 [Synoicihabitans sp.]
MGLSGLALAISALLVGCESTSARNKPQTLAAQSTGSVTQLERTGPPRVMQNGQQAANVKFGRVLSTQPTTIEGKRGLTGTLVGAGAGGMAVRPKIRTAEDLMIGTVGAVGGVIVGQATQEALTRRPGQEITIGLENGEVAVVIQDAEDGMFREGDSVKIVHSALGAYVSLATKEDRIRVQQAREQSGQPAWYEKQAADGSP